MSIYHWCNELVNQTLSFVIKGFKKTIKKDEKKTYTKLILKKNLKKTILICYSSTAGEYVSAVYVDIHM